MHRVESVGKFAGQRIELARNAGQSRISDFDGTSEVAILNRRGDIFPGRIEDMRHSVSCPSPFGGETLSSDHERGPVFRLSA